MKIKDRLVRLVNQFFGLFPTRLPTGMTEFDAWATSIIETYDLPTQNRDDILYVLSTSVIRTKETVYNAPKFHFVKLIRAVAAKQIAGAQFQGVKERQLVAQKLEAEATAKAQAAEVAVDNVSRLQPVPNA